MIYLVQNKTQTKFAFDILKKIPTLGADTETTGLDPIMDKVLLIQLGTEIDQFVFDVARIPEEDLKLILKILVTPNILKIFQNGKFDYKMLKSNFGIRVRNLADTMITEQLLTKGVKRSGFGLAELTEKYKAGSMNKSVRKGFELKKFGDSFTDEEIKYAANDVKVMYRIYNEQLKLAESKNMLKLLDLENASVRTTAELELNGIYINKEKWLALETAAIKGREEAEIILQKHFEPYYGKNIFGFLDINYLSPLQCKKALEKVLGEKVESTEAKYLKKFNHQVIKDLMKYREASKRITAFGKAFLKHVHPQTDRIHATYKQLGTDSGRESCTNPNMQQIPGAQEYRTPFCAQGENYRIISADFANQELRVLAQLSKEPTWIKAINNKRDLHIMVASMMFGKPEKDITKEERKRAKTLGFGTIYGLSAFGLARDLKIDKKEAKQLLNHFFNAFPNIKGFLKEQEKRTVHLKRAVSPLDGRIRDLSSVDWDDWRMRGHALNIGKNHPIQGASASITKLALIKIQNYIERKNKDAMLVAVIHDRFCCV